jgi:hypothetical protein
MSRDNILMLTHAFLVAFMSLMIVGSILYFAINDVRGTYTNRKTETCVSFNGIMLENNIFVSVVNTPVDYEPQAWEIESGRVIESPNGGYYIRDIQQGNYYITNVNFKKTILKVFSDETIEIKPLSLSNGRRIAIDGIELRRTSINLIYE